MWEWRKESGDTILHQFRSLGCAFDWSRQRFTMDDEYVASVYRVFVDWFDRGLIYRGKRVVNWDPALQTSVSDIETERKTVRGKLYHVRYPFADGSGHVTVATTRPETILADVAVAVHPGDERYKSLVGKLLIAPLSGREIPLIADMYPDPAFGTGALKITPAHDPNDYQVGARHNLPMPVCIDERARITGGSIYDGMDRFEARKRVVEDLEAQGLLEKTEDHDIPLAISERSGEPIEPLLSEQWFCDQPKLAAPVVEAVKRGEVKFHPERYERIFLDWMENIREWCVSRQLWWGQRIPVYYDADGNATAALSQEEAEQKAGRPMVRQDEDVLDTWFSSGLWPFATLGWPAQTEDMERFFPTSTLITDRNIINLWVARMAMMSYDLTGKRPFEDVVIYATVLNEKGQRMSKSLGTGVDPMGVLETVGADALRWTLLAQTGENQDIRYSERRVEEARNLANKLWNASRFVLMNVSEVPEGPGELEAVDKWLLSRLYATEKAVREAYDGFLPQDACAALYRFFWSELCDWYIEVSKSRLTDPLVGKTPQWVLLTALDAFLRMMHPVMPHLTEELYSHLPTRDKAPFVMSAPWPSLPESFHQPDEEARVQRAFEVTRALHALRADLEIAAMRTVPVAYYEGELAGGEAILASQGWVTELRHGRPSAGTKFISTTAEGVDIHLPLDGVVDTEKMLGRLEKETVKIEEELAKLRTRLANPSFVERAKPEVVERERAAAEELQSSLEKSRERRRLFE